MLIEFTVGNYRSFRDPVTFSMAAAKQKSKDPELDRRNVFEAPGAPAPLLVSAAIYGANAGGKSNLIAALAFMRRFVMHSARATSAEGGIAAEPFLLSDVTAGRPSSFEAIFVADGKRYRYGFEADAERVHGEWLYYVPSTREALLFERAGAEVELGAHFAKEARELIEMTRPNALFLSVVAQFNGQTALRVVDWFDRCYVLSSLSDSKARAFTERRLRPGRHGEEIARFLMSLDLGIKGLYAEAYPAQAGTSTEEALAAGNIIAELVSTYLEEERAARNRIAYGRGASRPRIKTLHTRYDAEGNPAGEAEFYLDQHESEGTKKLFAIAGPLLYALARGTPLVVDELDARLHPILTQKLVGLFGDPASNPRHAQLIFTTQDTNLLDGALLRRDQIWFVEKDSRGRSDLYSLAEIKGTRNDLQFERNYIQGRFGAVPFVGDLAAMLGEAYGEEAESDA